jgi:hypothetical protein
MARAILMSFIILCAALGTPASAAAAKASHYRHVSSSQSSNSVTYDRDSKDPNVGWHWEGGMRSCSNDCDNPEIPGSGYTCKNVQFMGMAMRECDWSSW